MGEKYSKKEIIQCWHNPWACLQGGIITLQAGVGSCVALAFLYWFFMGTLGMLLHNFGPVESSVLFSVYSNCTPWSVFPLWSWTSRAPGEWCWFTAPRRSAVSAGTLCIKRRDTESSLKVSRVCLLHANGALRGNGCWVAGMPCLTVL